MALWALYPAVTTALAAPIAFFPLQDISQDRNGIDIPFSRYLADRIQKSGTDVFSIDTVISFMANNRIRRPGELESYFINLAREELGVTYVLFGTVTQKKTFPALSLGIILNLVQTFDGRTVWTYDNTYSNVDFRKLLEIGEPKSVEKLQIVLGDDIISQWPGGRLNREELITASLDSFVLRPQHVTPGSKIYSSVHLRNLWAEGRAPRAFFKVNEQIHEASLDLDRKTFESSWIAAEKDGRFPVTLTLEWPLYGRTENFQLGSYLIDGSSPLIALDLQGESIIQDDIPVFKDEVIIVPRRLIRKPIVRWHLSFMNHEGMVVATENGKGELPEALIWHGTNSYGDKFVEGKYEVNLEVWDQAGNTASTTSQFALNNKLPKGTLAAKKSGSNIMLDITGDAKVPIAFWRLEMWSDKGKLLKTAEGTDLPVQIGLQVPTSEEIQDIEGRLVVQDILGNQASQQFSKLLGLTDSDETKKNIVEKQPATKSWVDEF